MKYIFLAGVHAVGKTTLTKELEKEIDIYSVSISDLIRKAGNDINSHQKNTINISNNQISWLDQLKNINAEESIVILDGHFSLLNENGNITPIDFEVFDKTEMIKIILVKQDPELIKKRLFNRDGTIYSVKKIKSHQNFEEKQAFNYANLRHIPIHIYDSNSSIDSLISFVVN